MAKKYAVTGRIRFANRLVEKLNRFGLAGSDTYTLTTTGRKSGEPRSTPVTIAIRDGARYLVSPYGDVGWVHNIRAKPSASLRQKGKSETINVTEVGAEEAGPVLKQYFDDLKIVRPYFDAEEGTPVEDFVKQADRHPVFRIDG